VSDEGRQRERWKADYLELTIRMVKQIISMYLNIY
jgi:hypothetical protein